MSIPTVIGVGTKLDDFIMATDVFDTAGTSSWTHPNPGNALEVQVTLIGGGGGPAGYSFSLNVGNTTDGGNGVAGTKTVWDVSGTPVTASGGGGGLWADGFSYGSPSASYGGNGFVKGHPIIPGNSDTQQQARIPGIPYGAGGRAGTTAGTSAGSQFTAGGGGSGFFKTFKTTVTNNVDIIVGSGGVSGNANSDCDLNNIYIEQLDGEPGAVIVQYAKAAKGIPAPIAKEFVEEWIDKDRETADSGVWNHPNPGTAIEMTVICIGGAGGNTDLSLNGTNGSNGSDTTFDSVTGLGGNGGIMNETTAVAAAVAGGFGGSVNPQTYSNGGSAVLNTTGFGLFGAVNQGENASGIAGLNKGGSGGISIKRISVTGNVNYTVGAGGAEGIAGAGAGLSGGIILKYSK